MRPAFYMLLGVLLVPTVGLVGDIVTDGKFKSTKLTGAPLQVASVGMVANLNADMVDGVEGTDLYTKAEVDALVAAAVESAEPRGYYLTDTTHRGSAADVACGTGFHMASLWEISQPSNLRYAYEHPDAHTSPDSAQGPPTSAPGWIRTGGTSGSLPTPGQANCLAWASSSDFFQGTRALLPSDWSNPALGGTYALVWGTPWAAELEDCNVYVSVWCIQD